MDSPTAQQPILTTSPSYPEHESSPRASASADCTDARPCTPSIPSSPALSTASTADAGPSPPLPALPAPQLPERVLALLRTPPSSSGRAADDDDDDETRFVTTSWGSPYPQSDTSHLRLSSLSSEPSEDSPIHRLELNTPFLRPAPFLPDEGRIQHELSSSLHVGNPSSLVSAAVLANRARRPARGLTEDWIRQHTTGDIGSEARLWLSDSSDGDSENSLLSGSVSGDTPAWSGDDEINLRTPRARPLKRSSSRSSHSSIPLRNGHHGRQSRHRLSSIETLRESDIRHLRGNSSATMASAISHEVEQEAVQANAPTAKPEPAAAPALPPKESPISKPDAAGKPAQAAAPRAPAMKSPTKDRIAPRRSKKKVPWKGKTIVVLLPLDEGRGKPGHSPMPLSRPIVESMQQSWKELGYDIDGFDLFNSDVDLAAVGAADALSQSMSRTSWPREEDVAQERSLHKYPVLLPDLNAWKNYVQELNEAKLRALGVSFGDEPPLPPLPPSVSPGIGASISRQSSATMYPPLPFSPPIPTSSASSNHGAPGFTFPAAFIPSHSPSLSSVTSPVSFGMASKYNARQSISIPAGTFQMPPQQPHTPGGFSPNLFLQHGLVRGGSPSLAAFSSVMSPTSSPFSSDGFSAPPLHQRHQSLQYPMLQHQMQHQMQSQARASPRLQDLAEEDERAIGESSPAKIAELPAARSASVAAQAPFIQHNASSSLQKEIDDAEYHLEEQFRSQFEHDRAYSPHGERQFVQVEKPAAQNHVRDMSVQFAPPPAIQRFRDDSENGPPLHHPRPHSRGHSLANAYYTEPDEVPQDAKAPAFGENANLISPQNGVHADEAYEIETNPSNLGTPTPALDFNTALQQQQHQRSFSTTSNPWSDTGSLAGKSDAPKRSSHGSKASLSRFNADAPEFKFNPGGASTFQSSIGSQFSFGNGASEAFQPSIFHSGLPSQASANLGQFAFPVPAAASAKINASAPVFSPGQSEFSFSTSGPKFRPDAPSFTPLHSISNSLTSPIQSGGESVGGNRTSSIFGNIDLNLPDAGKAARRSKAVPIVQPTSSSSPMDKENDEPQYDKEGRVTDDSRVKRARATHNADDDDEVLFALPKNDKPDVAAATSAADEDSVVAEETTVSSTLASETTEAKLAGTRSPSEVLFPTTIPQGVFNFQEFKPEKVNSVFRHKKSLSAVAKPFTPGASLHSNPMIDDAITEDETIPSFEEAAAEIINEETEAVEEALDALGADEPHTTAVSAIKPKGLSSSRYASSPSPPSPPPKADMAESTRLMSSSPPPVPLKDDLPAKEEQVNNASEPVPSIRDALADEREPTFEEIDDIMSHLNSVDPAQGLKRTMDLSWHQPDAPLPRQMLQSTAELEHAFVDQVTDVAQHNANGESMGGSEWARDFTDEEQLKLESRVNFFDGRVNDVVGGLLSARLGPLEESLEQIRLAMTSMSGRTLSSRRDGRNMSGEMQESDADDEDDEMPVPIARRSLSPRKDRRMEQMRAMVLDALASQEQNKAAASESEPGVSMATILKSLNEVKEQFGESLRLDFRGEDLRNIVEDAVERRMPVSPLPDTSKAEATQALEARIAELESQLQVEEGKTNAEVALRRVAEEQTVEMQRELAMAQTKIEVEIMNRQAFDQRVTDLEGHLKQQEEKAEAEVAERRRAEDRLSEVQRLLRIASEEETRLREKVEDQERELKAALETNGANAMRVALLEASEAKDSATFSDLQQRTNAAEEELRDKVQEMRHWRAEAERAIDLSQQQGNDLLETATELRHVKRVVDTLGTQLEENERLREAWRGKFATLQEEMARAARGVAEESAQHIKREQVLLARQEVLEAKLQAEARTRERLESELERLESGERQAMRAVAECKRLEAMMGELRAKNEELHQSATRYQAEFGEARESAAREVQRTREAMQAEVDAANYTVNAVRRELEDEVARARSQVDQVRMDADTARARLEMLLEEAEAAGRRTVAEEAARQESAAEDQQARYERQLQNAAEDAQRTEESLLERLSISASKTELLQDRVAHLEEKVEVAREAAQVAAQAAARARAATGAATETAATAATATRGLQPAAALTATLGLPAKISPQALRESIIVLQEQLQQREQRIEEVELALAQTDPEAETKIAKRDDEIVWLRELLAVRHADLQDIVTALGRDDHDPERVRDAAIRLQANLQMEEQERERAMNGGSAITLPSLAATLRDAATPRVAQAVLPLAAAWGNWRRSREAAASVASPAPSRAPRGPRAAATPSRPSSGSVSSRDAAESADGALASAFLSGLLTPPTSGVRQTPTSRQSLSLRLSEQPTAFASTGRRYTAEQPPLATRPGRSDSRRPNAPLRNDTTPPPAAIRRPSRSQPITPPMMRTGPYDEDAQAEDFDDAAFFDD